MPSTINADNGVSSGSAGLKSTADSSGVLSLQTNGTTAVTVNTSQNVGVGTASPTYKLDVVDSAVNAIFGLRVKTTGTGGQALLDLDTTASGGTAYLRYLGAGTENARISADSTAIYFSTGTGPTERMRIDAATGNVGIGFAPVANNGILQLNSYGAVQALIEKATISATAATGTINFDAVTQAVLYYTSNASANWTVNIRGSSGLTLNSMMQTGQSLTVAFLVTQGATAYYNSAVQVDGNAVTPKYQGGSAWTAGNASSIDAYVYTIVKTGSAAFTVFASQTQFK